MMRNFTLIALSCFLIVFTSSCTKDSVGSSNAGGTSSYTFDGSPGSCATPAVAGFYSAGVTLNATNTLTFTVNVTVKGTYSVNTTASNGVFFSGSGTFTTTGSQTVVLTGNGTPIKAGSFPFVPVTSNTCNFTVSFLSGAPSAVFTYAGGTGNCTAPQIQGVYATGVALGSGNYVDLAVNVTTPGAYTVSTNSANGISFSGSGTFTAGGGSGQVIRLIGNGTPAAPVSASYTPSGGCNFSITAAPPPPPASFTYTCTPAIISGTFAAGTALTSSSTVKVGVNVTTTGLYSVTTNGSNGVTFSASGVFSVMGNQTITLTSTNTPTAANTFSYTPTGAGCFFDITYTSGPPPPADFLKCTIDGVAKDFSTNLGGIFMPGLFSADGDLGTSSFTVSVIDNNGDPITVGTYNKATLSNLTRYASASYLPDNSNPLGAWQPFPINSNPFTVIIETITTTPNKVTGKFFGDIFDNMGANKKIVTNGTFSVSY